MEHLLFSVNATLPIFLVMAVGWCLRRMNLMDGSFVDKLNAINYKLTLPVLLFTDMAGADFFAVWDTKFVLFCFFATLLSFFAILAVALIFLRGRAVLGEFVQGCYRSSAAVLGIALIQNIYGSATIAPLMILGSVPLYNVLAVCVLTFTDQENSGKPDLKRIGKAVRGVLTNPLIIGIALGFAASLLRLDLPKFADKTLGYFAGIATPLALLALGAGFEGRKALSGWKLTLAAGAIKLIVLGAVFVPVALAMGFRGEQLVGLFVMLCAPTTVSCYVMARNLHHEGVLTSSVVVSTTLLSSVTLTAWIWLLRSLGYL